MANLEIVIDQSPFMLLLFVERKRGFRAQRISFRMPNVFDLHFDIRIRIAVREKISVQYLPRLETRTYSNNRAEDCPLIQYYQCGAENFSHATFLCALFGCRPCFIDEYFDILVNGLNLSKQIWRIPPKIGLIFQQKPLK